MSKTVDPFVFPRHEVNGPVPSRLNSRGVPVKISVFPHFRTLSTFSSIFQSLTKCLRDYVASETNTYTLTHITFVPYFGQFPKS